MRFTDQGIRALPSSGNGQREYAEDSGLIIRVGKRTKTFIVRCGSGRKRVSLGRYPADLSLAAAREKAKDVLAADRLKKTEAPALTFSEAFETYDRVHVANLRKGSQRAIRQTCARRFLPKLGKKQLTTIRPTDIAPILDTMLDTPTERHNAFVYLAMFFNWCTKRGYIETAPTARMDKPKKPASRERVLSPQELVAVWNATAGDDDYSRIVRLSILSGQRIGQWAACRREYIQGDIIVWPAETMKSRRAHTLPLTETMRTLLPDRIGLLFPTMNARGFSNWSRGKHRLDIASSVVGYTHHDLRRTFATICADDPLNVEPHIVESILAHSIGTAIARIYNRAKYLEPMRKALLVFEEWLHLQLAKPEEPHGRQLSTGAHTGIHHRTA